MMNKDNIELLEKYKNVIFSQQFYSKFTPKSWSIKSVKLFYLKKLDLLNKFYLNSNELYGRKEFDDIINGLLYIDITFSNPDSPLKNIIKQIQLEVYSNEFK